jgi:SRSO17 transposase
MVERRFETRKQEILEDCQLSGETFRGALRRLEQFAQPFLQLFQRREQREHAQTYLQGLLSQAERKNAEAIAYRADQDRMPLQSFLGESTWDWQPLMDELARRVGETLGEVDGVIVFDPSGFPKKGDKSVGVARQWCGRAGKVDNCQVGVYMGYVSSKNHALVDMRLYLPKEWTSDRKRRKEAHVPKEIRFRTRHDLALQMLDRHAAHLPHGWVCGDDEMGRSSRFRRDLARRNERYLLAVPSNTHIRDEQQPLAPGARKPAWQRMDAWVKTLSEQDWTRVEVRDAEKGPLTLEIVSRAVRAKDDRRREGPEELMVVTRQPDESGKRLKHDYYLSNTDVSTPLLPLAKAACAEHQVEESIKRAKSETGLGDYQVRNWHGWHHHQALSLVACWFVVLETLLGKKQTPALTVNQVRRVLSHLIDRAWKRHQLERVLDDQRRWLVRIELARLYAYRARNRLPPRKLPPPD